MFNYFSCKTWVVERISKVNLTKGYSHTMAIMVAMDILRDSTHLLLGHTLPEHTLRSKVIHLKTTHQQDILLVLTHYLGILVHQLHTIQVRDPNFVFAI